jgi:hypothetical protein
MEPTGGRGLGSSGGAVVAAIVIALIALAMANTGGGPSGSLVSHQAHVTAVNGAARFGQG